MGMCGGIVRLLAAAALVGLAGIVSGQVIYIPQPIVQGVLVDADGVVKVKTDAGPELGKIRVRVQAARSGAGDGGMVYVSLPKIFADARAAYDAGKELPENVRYLDGLQSVKYVLIYPDENDLVLAGPGGPWETVPGIGVVGKTSGRPVMHWEDLVVLLREAHNKAGVVGCSIDPAAGPAAQKISDDVAKQNAGKSPAVLAAALAKALGPQKIRVLGVSGAMRAATVMVGADVKLKRLSLGLETPAVPGIPAAFDATAGGSRLWFELNYEPVGIAPDGLAYELRGPKLKVRAGAKMFSPGGATPAAEKFAQAVTDKITDLTALTPAWGELANVADLGVVAALIRRDNLDQKANWDLAWVFDESNAKWEQYVTPRSMDTLVAVGPRAVASGGVSLGFAAAANQRTTVDDLAAVREKKPAVRP